MFNFHNLLISSHHNLLRWFQKVQKWLCIHAGIFLLCSFLILGIGICPLLLENIIMRIYERSYTWDLSPHLYFLAPGQQPRDPLTQLLIINKTGILWWIHHSQMHSLLQVILIKHKTWEGKNELLTSSA